jgi:hypothetical protein
LDTKSLKDPCGAVIHSDRDANVKFPHRPTQELVCGCVEAHHFSGERKLALGDLERIHFWCHFHSPLNKKADRRVRMLQGG